MIANISHYLPITDPTMIFLVVMFLILAAPIVMGKLRIPHIVGMVLAGVLVGKYGLNILERDSLSSFSERWVCTTSCFLPDWRWT